MAVAPGVRQPLQQDEAHALAPHHAVGGRGERLAPGIRGQTTLTGELDERARGGHHRHPAGQGEGAFALP